jgi:hypothetical protein
MVYIPVVIPIFPRYSRTIMSFPHNCVIPAKAGIQKTNRMSILDSRLRGNDRKKQEQQEEMGMTKKQKHQK